MYDPELAHPPALIASAGRDRFVPAGFVVARERIADLDGDGTADRALVLRRRRADADGSRPRRLVVLRGRGGERFDAAGTGRRILLCTRCGGAFYGLSAPPIRLSVKGGNLVVRQERGSRVVTAQAFRLRLRAGATALIGYDRTDRDRATGRVVVTSTNLLTGKRTVTTTTAAGQTTTRAITVDPCAQPLARVRASDPLHGC